ncbi:MAG: autotransporter assembly complex protein TamA [Alphaproteobacteria bacterium]
MKLMRSVFCCAVFLCFVHYVPKGNYSLANPEKALSQYKIIGVERDTELMSALVQVLQRQQQSVGDQDAQERLYLEDALRSDLLKTLYSKGYYDAQVLYEDRAEGVYKVILGEPVYIGRVTASPKKYKAYLTDASIQKGDILDASRVFKSQDALYRALQEDSCALHLAVDHKVFLDTQSRKASLEFLVDKGEDVALGSVVFVGTETVDPVYLQNFIPWEIGACFRRKNVETLRQNVLKTGLFERVDISLPQAGDVQKGDEIPVTVILEDRPQRSIRAGISYYTDEGPGAVFGWEHRNFWGEAEKVNIDLTLSALEQSLDFAMDKPFFWRHDQSLVLGATIGREDNDAYSQLEISANAALQRQFSKRLSGHGGLAFILNRIEEDNDDEEENYALLSPFASLNYDSRNHPLDPHHGWLLRTTVRPYFDVIGQADPFLKLRASAQSYLEIHKSVVFAGRFVLGSISGGSTDNIPASERFYAGGGGSVRGFGYQEIGPFEDGDPLGGRSLAEGSFEARLKLSDTIGIVGFVDAGHVSDQTFPDFGVLSVGAGVGVRYYTDFGPLRFDVGLPVSGKENSDSNFQIYISIGQAF